MPKSTSPRRTALWKESSLYGLGAIVAQIAYLNVIVGVGKNPPPPPEFWIKAWTLGPSALVFWILSASAYAQSKGHSRRWGALGLLTCCGFALLMFLPNRWRDDDDVLYEPGDYPRPRR